MAVAKYAISSDPAHLKLAFSFLGLKEGPGAGNNPTVIKFYADVGHSWVKQDSVAWCAAFAGAMLARSGLPHTSALTARSYLDWGKKTTSPKRGDIVVFMRGNSSWQGHVAFYLGEASGRIYVIGGNQSDAVTVTSYPKSKLLGFRTAVTVANSRTSKALGLASTGMASVATGEGMEHFSASLSEAGGTLQMLSMISPWFMVIGAALTVAGIAWAAYARWSDWKEKAR